MFEAVYDISDARGWLPAPKRTGAIEGVVDAVSDIYGFVAVLTVTLI